MAKNDALRIERPQQKMYGLGMDLAGTATREGKFWVMEIPAIDGMTQGRSRKEGLRMAEDLLRCMANRKNLVVRATYKSENDFILSVRDTKIIRRLLGANRAPTNSPLLQLVLFVNGRNPRFYNVKKIVLDQIFCLLSQNKKRRPRANGDSVSAIPSMNEGFAKRGYGACALAAARFNAGYTQDFLAAATGIRQPHLSLMENGKRPIGKISAKRLGIALECDWRDFTRI